MTAPAREVQLCVLRVGGNAYVIDLKRVDEILSARPITAVPRAPAFLEGVTRLRGEVLPVVDVRRRLGLSLPDPSDRRAQRQERLLVCRIGRRRVGFVVDAVSQVRRVPLAELRPAPLAAVPGRPQAVIGVCGEEGHLLLMLDLKALLEEA